MSADDYIKTLTLNMQWTYSFHYCIGGPENYLMYTCTYLWIKSKYEQESKISGDSNYEDFWMRTSLNTWGTSLNNCSWKDDEESGRIW